ncbi:ABC transporter permease [Phytohabitans houttuyneae]|uniref:Transport permease protein n=1 Tax=Phytohabitans houttuyneae TaxID=1076126 RepID=A0A6V8K2Y0_9ACTN|nr:ABC transporter permease [Phytohabitans houttuyneae]GFJ76529.1 transport permease protein [Phytohabitans houttuyneae]
MKLARDTWLVFQAQMSLMLRSRTWLIFGLAQPITYLVLFAPMLKPALASMGADSYGDAYRVYVPGLLVVMCLYGGLFTGFGLLAELRAGIIERARVTPVSRSALLLGRALRDVASLLVQALIITAIAVPFGLSVGVLDLLLAYLLLCVIALMTTSVSYAVTLIVRKEGALGPVMNTVAQPVALLAGVLLPVALAPAWIQAIADWNPFYWVTNGMRSLFEGNTGDTAIWQGLVGVTVLATVAIAWSTRLFTRTIR